MTDPGLGHNDDGTDSGRRGPSVLVSAMIALSVGAMATVAAASFLGGPWRDALALTGWAVLGAGLVTLVGTGLGLLARERSLATQVALLAGTAIAAPLAGAVLAARAMFVSDHDLRALFVILAVGATAAAVTALGLAGRLGRAAEEVTRLSRMAVLAVPPPPKVALPTELAEVTNQLTSGAQEVQDSRRREQAVEASRRELVAWVSHDLRTPLTGIRALVEALEDGVVTDPAAVARYHRTIRQEADRLARLVDDLFELSRIQAGALDLDLQLVGLAEVVSDALAASSAVAGTRGVAVHGEIRDPTLEVEASLPELSRVLHNLIDNAIRHTPSGGRVVVEAGAEGGHALLSVSDGCGGIPDGDLDRVFDLGFRGDRARSPDETLGGGFGLAIAQGLVAAHDGQLAVANHGSGCRFTVRLPRDP